MYIWMDGWSSLIAGYRSIANPARGQLNRENDFSPSPFASENLPRETGSAVSFRVSLLMLHTQAESIAYSIPPAFLDGVHLCRQPPSGQSRVNRVTQLRTEGVQ